MNMRQQRITTSQQEVYLIYLMEHVEFAASRIKDGDCCCCFIFALFLLFLFTYIQRFCENYVLEMLVVVVRSFTFFFLYSQVNRSTKKIGKSSQGC